MRARNYAAFSGVLPGVLIGLMPFASFAHAADVQSAVELTTRTVRSEESNLASIVGDAIRAVDKADIGIIAAASFTEMSIPPGPVKSESVVRCLQFRSDTVVVMRLTGAQVRAALEHALALYPSRNAVFLQVSGMTVTVDSAGPKGSRVAGVKVGKLDLDDKRTYRVAMPSPLSTGALGYSKVWSRADLEKDTTKTLEDAVTSYVASLTALEAKPDARIIFRR